MIIHKTKPFKENVRYVLRDNAPDDIMTYVRKYFDIPSHITRFSFVAGKTLGHITRDQFGNNVVRADNRCYFKADKENTQELPSLEEFALKPRFEERVWYELRSDAVSHFKFTHNIMLSLGIVSHSVFRFTPDSVDSAGNAIVGREKILASDLAMFNRELDIQVGKKYQIRESHVGVAWRLLPERARTLLFNDRWCLLTSKVIQCSSIEKVVEMGSEDVLIDEGIAILPISAAKFMLYEV